jgi:hypothetical protein
MPTIKQLADGLCLLLASAHALLSPAEAAGIDSHAYSCADLQALIAAHRFVFIGNPDFQDFAVADQSECPAEGTLVWRTVPTRDRPECLVYMCGGGHAGGDD